MARTYGQVKTEVLKLLDNYSSRGVIPTPSKIADYSLKIQSLTNATIYELASSTAKIPAVFQIAHAPIKNTPSDDTSSIKQHLPGTDFSISLINARSCFFETTGPATVVIEESADNVTFTPLQTITIATTTVFTEYRRLITPTLSTNWVRLRFTGNYVYDFRNYVLYDVTWPSEADVQQHRPIFEIALPADFFMFNEAFIKNDGRQNIPFDNGYFITPDKKFCFDSYLVNPAEIIVNYWRRPNLLTFTGVDATDEAQTIDLADDAAIIIPWNVAGEIFKSEQMMGPGGFLINQFMVKRDSLITNKSNYSSTIINTTGW